MSVLIIGSEGAQGKRYKAILDYLGKSYLCRDVGLTEVNKREIEHAVDSIIIATPTNTHCKIIREFLKYKKPILIEKPISKYITEVRDLIHDLKPDDTLTMVMQYRHLVPDSARGQSYYNYFRHGNDGLIWDCLQIIALSRGQVRLAETSPVWQCQINGEMLKLNHMDAAYVEDVKAWLNGYQQDPLSLLAIHEKVDIKAKER